MKFERLSEFQASSRKHDETMVFSYVLRWETVFRICF